MSHRNRDGRQRLDNSFTELIAAASVFGTGGSQLSSYDTVAFANNYALITLNRIILTYLYSGNGIFQTAIQLPLQDALAKGIEIESGELNASDIDDVIDWLEMHNAWQRLQDYRSWVRVYGGGALVINSNQEPDARLDWRRLKGSEIEFYDVDRWQMSSPDIQMAAMQDYESIENAEILYLNGVKIDPSRVILGSGKRAPSYIRRMLIGWGMSEADRMLRDINNYIKTQDVLYQILDESKIDVYHIKGLAAKMFQVGGTQAVINRVQAANQLKNYVHALVMDTEETFEQKTMTFSGLADVMRENRIGVASALRMPMTKLFGLSASGFSTGEEDTDNYNAMVEAEIRRPMRPDIRKVISVAMANMWGRVPSFRWDYLPLKEVPALEQEQILESKTNRILALYDRGLAGAEATVEMLAKEEVIDANMVGQMNQTPVPPNGPESVAPTKSDTISTYKKAVDSAKALAAGVRDRALKIIRG